MYLRLVDYILKVTTAPVHDRVSIAHWLTACLVHMCLYLIMSHPLQTHTGGIYVVVVAIITGNALERDSHYMVYCSPDNSKYPASQHYSSPYPVSNYSIHAPCQTLILCFPFIYTLHPLHPCYP